MLLKDKVVIITGVGAGMGRKLALIAAEEGANVAICARSQDFIEGVAREIEAKGGRAIAVKTDVAEMDQCQRLADATTKAFGRIDGLVNCAYQRASFGSFETDPLEVWVANMNVTCFGALRMVKACLPTMKAQRSGAVVNILTIGAVKPFQGEADYATAKGALGVATRMLAHELGQYNIRVNGVRMGWLWGTKVEGWIPPDEECAKSVLFFLSDYSKMATGAVMDVNGGEYMPP
jgi:NAD(P)-dependent dehydrogenase (short-subunit alcohol dehydrogenase family)